MLIIPHYRDGRGYYSVTQICGILDLDSHGVYEILKILKERGYAKYFASRYRTPSAHYNEDVVHMLVSQAARANMSTHKGTRDFFKLVSQFVEEAFPAKSS